MYVLELIHLRIIISSILPLPLPFEDSVSYTIIMNGKKYKFIFRDLIDIFTRSKASFEKNQLTETLNLVY